MKDRFYNDTLGDPGTSVERSSPENFIVLHDPLVSLDSGVSIASGVSIDSFPEFEDPSCWAVAEITSEFLFAKCSNGLRFTKDLVHACKDRDGEDCICRESLTLEPSITSTHH